MKLTKNQLKELIRHSIREVASELGEGGPGSGRPTKPGSKRDIEKTAMSAADAANKKMDAAEKRKKNEGGKGSGRPKEKTGLTGQPLDNYRKSFQKYRDEKKKEDAKKKNKKESVKESRGRRCTVKEVKKWFKTLEENRYKKTYASDARRVSWLVNNNLSEDYESMPISMRKKWSKAQYGRERYLAKEFVKHLNSKELTESKLRKVIRESIKRIIEGKIVRWEIPTKDKKKVQAIVKKLRLKDTKDYSIYGSGKTFEMELDSKYENKVLELLMKMNIKVRG